MFVGSHTNPIGTSRKTHCHYTRLILQAYSFRTTGFRSVGRSHLKWHPILENQGNQEQATLVSQKAASMARTLRRLVCMRPRKLGYAQCNLIAGTHSTIFHLPTANGIHLSQSKKRMMEIKELSTAPSAHIARISVDLLLQNAGGLRFYIGNNFTTIRTYATNSTFF